MDIKDIIEMWDDIDAMIVDLIFAIAERAGNTIEDEEQLETDAYGAALVPDVRENIVAFLEKHGYEFITPEYTD